MGAHAVDASVNLPHRSATSTTRSLRCDEEHHAAVPRSAQTSACFTYAWSTHALWLFGDEAVRSRARMTRSRSPGDDDHSYSETLAFAYAAPPAPDAPRYRRGRCSARKRPSGLCERYGFAYYGDWASVLIGWARGQNDPGQGVRIIESALARLDANRAQARRPYLSRRCWRETYSRLQRARCGPKSILDRAIEMAVDRGDVWWLPALYLQRSELEAGRSGKPRF